MEGGTEHEHIAQVRWRNSADGTTGTSSRAAMVEFINAGKLVEVTSGQRAVRVGVYRKIYLRSFANNEWSNNLLSLPRY